MKKILAIAALLLLFTPLAGAAVNEDQCEPDFRSLVRDQLYKVYNDSGSTIAVNKLVYVSGWDESNQAFEISLADADVSGARVHADQRLHRVGFLQMLDQVCDGGVEGHFLDGIPAELREDVVGGNGDGIQLSATGGDVGEDSLHLVQIGSKHLAHESRSSVVARHSPRRWRFAATGSLLEGELQAAARLI